MNGPTIYSFSYKQNGQDQFATTGQFATLIIDCRGLWNPHQDKAMRVLTGRSWQVQQRMEQLPEARLLINMAVNYLDIKPGGRVAFGCSWGKHRSVALAELTAAHFPESTIVHTSKSMTHLLGGPFHAIH